MPTYEYECKNCGYIFEEFKSISDNSIPHCPVCNSGNVVKLIRAGAGIIFKGTGFYTTDYKKNNSYKNNNIKYNNKMENSDNVSKNKTENNKN